MKNIRRGALVALFLAATAAGLVLIAMPGRDEAEPIDPTQYVGNSTCLSCHQDKSAFQGTAHHLTSRLPSRAAIQGSFREGEDVLGTSNPYLYFRMQATDSGFYQTAVMATPGDTISRSERFGIVIGSGRKGQTYLHWQKHNLLFQLPVSYWTSLRDWINSPGYHDGAADFDRPVTPRCLECHTSYFEVLPDSGTPNRYNPANFILGISCERCHGPGQEHVARQNSWIARSLGQAIINPARLPRERQIEVCAQCHGGVGELRTPAFSYLPGEPLVDHLHVEPPNPAEAVDVHGNQVALLARSPCFQSSQMTCGTCHNVHETERNAAAFSKKCLTCHQVQSCGLFPERGHQIAQNCVDCHMPELPSNTIVSASDGRTAQPRVRTHWIKVYPETRNLRPE